MHRVVRMDRIQQRQPGHGCGRRGLARSLSRVGKGTGLRPGSLRVVRALEVSKATRPKALKCPLRTLLPANPLSDEVGEGAQGVRPAQGTDLPATNPVAPTALPFPPREGAGG